jgi:homoserine dehydrogenase
MHEDTKLALIGFGNVGQALARLLISKKEELARRYEIIYRVVGIATGRHGAAINPDGIALETALHMIEAGGDLSALSLIPPSTDMTSFLHACHADVLFENTPVNYATGQPAIEHMRTALEIGMHAITANKGPVVHAYHLLSELALSKGRAFLFESTVMDGAPIFSLWREALLGARLSSFRGILNSTTNLILTLMEDGISFEDAVIRAQEMGIAETDPSGDVDGWDAAIKVAALVTVLMDVPFSLQEVERQGIGNISEAMVLRELELGNRWKLICEARREGDRIIASVHPQVVDAQDPLFTVMGTSSAITFQSDVLGALTIREEDPGPHTTAYGLLADFIHAVG